MNATETLAALVVVLSLAVIGLQWQITALGRSMSAPRPGLEKERKAAGSSAGHPSSVESTHESLRLTAGFGVVPPPQAQGPRLVTPARARRDLERKFALRARETERLRKAVTQEAAG